MICIVKKTLTVELSYPIFQFFCISNCLSIYLCSCIYIYDYKFPLFWQILGLSTSLYLCVYLSNLLVSIYQSSICLPIYIFACLTFSPYIYLHINLFPTYLLICQPFFFFLFSTFFLIISPSIWLYFSLFFTCIFIIIFTFIYLSLYLFSYISTYLSVYISVIKHLCLNVSLSKRISN